MPSIKKRDWVKRGTKRGFVTEAQGHYCRVSWLHEGRTQRVTRRSVKPCSPPVALLLEGALDSDLRSERTERGLLKEYLRGYDIRLAARTIHSLDDLRHFDGQLRKMPFLFVHISCHGSSGDASGPAIWFSRNAPAVLLSDESCVELFQRYFRGRNVLLSACELGKYKKPMREFKRRTGIARLAAFSREIHDHEAILFDLFLYHCMIENGWSFEKAIAAAVEAMKQAKLTGRRGREQSLVRVF